MIDDFININFVLHPKAISETANRKISDDDVILTFSHSKLVERILVDAAAEGKRPRVIVAEARSPGLPAQVFIIIIGSAMLLPTKRKARFPLVTNECLH